jgi:general secretion pathway protein G
MVKKGTKGFTLIEILIVVAIIAILASVVLIGLGPTQQAGRDARRLADLRQTQNGLELYFNKCGYYPGTSVASPCGAWAAVSTWAALTTALTGAGVGVNQVPSDPTSGRSYMYGTTAGGSSYILAAGLENTNNQIFNTYVGPSSTGYTIGNGFTSCGAPTYCITL